MQLCLSTTINDYKLFNNTSVSENATNNWAVQKLKMIQTHDNTHTHTHTHSISLWNVKTITIIIIITITIQIFMFTIVVVNIITNDANILNHVRIRMIQYHYQAISPDAKYFPLESNATEVTALVWPFNSATCCFVATSHILTVLSPEPVKKRRGVVSSCKIWTGIQFINIQILKTYTKL